MKVGLFLVGERGFNVLTQVHDKINLQFVLSYKDNNIKDNGFEDMFKFCLDNKIKFIEGKNIDQELYNICDKIFVIGWQYMLKSNLDKIIVFHDSYLPKYKGWAPTVNYLIEGSNYLAATAFSPTYEMDTGDIYLRKHQNIDYPIKIVDALKIVSQLYSKMIIEIYETNPKLTKMEKEETFCIWRDYEDYFINWNHSAIKIKRFVDAVGYPYNGAKIKVYGEDLTVNDCEVIKKVVVNQNDHIGKLFNIDNGIATVICGEYMIKLTDVTDSQDKPYYFKKLKIRL